MRKFKWREVRGKRKGLRERSAEGREKRKEYECKRREGGRKSND